MYVNPCPQLYLIWLCPSVRRSKSVCSCSTDKHTIFLPPFSHYYKAVTLPNCRFLRVAMSVLIKRDDCFIQREHRSCSRGPPTLSRRQAPQCSHYSASQARFFCDLWWPLFRRLALVVTFAKLVFPEFTICAVSIVDGIVAEVQVVTSIKKFLLTNHVLPLKWRTWTCKCMAKMCIQEFNQFFFLLCFALIISDCKYVKGADG